MPLKLNGYTVPWTALGVIIGGILSVGALQFQVNANAEDIQRQAQVPVKLAQMEMTLKHIKETVDEEKAARKEDDKDLEKKLDQILDKLDER